MGNYIPRSHKGGLMVSITDKRGPHIYFTKRASAFNNCVGDKLRGGKGDRQARKAAFKSAVQTCRGSKK